VCQTLSVVAALGITVVAVIHQPRVEIFESVSDLLVLEPGGRVAFQGPQAAAEPYFTEVCGMRVRPGRNPADVMLDVISGSATAVAGGKAIVASTVWAEHGEAFLAAASGGGAGGAEGAGAAARWAPVAKEHATGRRFRSKVDGLQRNRGASFLRQLWLCLCRSFLQQYRLIPALALEMGVAVIAGVAMGVSVGRLGELYMGVLAMPFTAISPSPLPTVLPSLGMYVSLAIGMSGSPAGVMTFNEERQVYFREASSGHNRLAYFLAKNLAALPRIAADGLHFCALFVVFAHPFTSFQQLYLIVSLQYLAVYGLAAMTGMVVPRENAALLAVIVAMIAGVLSGFGPTLHQLDSWNLGWLVRVRDAGVPPTERAASCAGSALPSPAPPRPSARPTASGTPQCPAPRRARTPCGGTRRCTRWRPSRTAPCSWSRRWPRRNGASPSTTSSWTLLTWQSLAPCIALLPTSS